MTLRDGWETHPLILTAVPCGDFGSDFASFVGFSPPVQLDQYQGKRGLTLNTFWRDPHGALGLVESLFEVILTGKPEGQARVRLRGSPSKVELLLVDENATRIVDEV